MSYLENIRGKFEDAMALKGLAGAFREINVRKIPLIRARFERNASFFREISILYDIVEKSATKAQGSVSKISLAAPAVLSIAVTSNERFFGELNANVMARFLADTRTRETDALIIGLTGANYLGADRGSRKLRFVSFDIDFPTHAEARVLLNTIFSRYARVFVYYPKFETALTQLVDVVDITHTPENTVFPVSEAEMVAEPIYEPELSEIVLFFETQIRSLLFMRVMLECELSRTAARLLAMTDMEERALHAADEAQREVSRVIASIRGAQLLETFAARKKWNRAEPILHS